MATIETNSVPSRKLLLLLAVFAATGLMFAAVSTHDFVQHLDRQVHSVTCSFVPGLGKADDPMASGCRTVLMSPYSSVLRGRYWGGIPVALPAMSVFSYLLFMGLWLFAAKDNGGRATTRFLVAATALPDVVSAVYLLVSAIAVGTLCKLCVGIYIASTGVFATAVIAHLLAGPTPGPWPWKRYCLWFGEGVALVAVPLVAFLAFRPAYESKVLGCGQLAQAEDRYDVHIKLHSVSGGTPAIEVVDPLCPACQSFRGRLQQSGLIDRLDLTGVLFPLDNSCNWMISDALHPGACTVSEAVLCAGDEGAQVVGWALDHGEELRTLAKKDAAALRAVLEKQFPSVAGCVGTPAVRARLNKSLRWVAANALPILTPQLFVRGHRLCEEDTDLGLEFALGQLLAEESKPATRGRHP